MSAFLFLKNQYQFICLSLLVAVSINGNYSYAQSLSVQITNIQHVLCFGGYTGSAEAQANGGISPYNFYWDNASTGYQLNGVAAGTYTVTVVDNIGDSAQATVTINEPPPLDAPISATAVNCNGLCDGQASVSASGGVSPYTYNWNDSNNQTNATAVNLCPGSYNVLTTDANGCSAFSSVSISEPAAMNLSLSSTQASCNGSDGSAMVSVTGGMGGYSYSWDDPLNQTTDTASGLTAGYYSLEVTDQNGCMVNGSIAVETPNAPAITMTLISDVSCYGGNDGEATAIATAGTSPYTYQWNDSNIQTTATATNLTAGVYAVLVTDDLGCAGVETVTINQAPALMLSATTTDEMSGNDGTIDLTVSGGTPGYNYNWSGPNGYVSSTEDPVGLTAGDYSVMCEDANGCTDSLTITINSQLGIVNAATIKVDFYPNPSRGIVQIKSNQQKGMIHIYNAIGQEQCTFQVFHETNTLDLTHLKKGIYLIEFQTEDTSIIEKIILN